MKDFKTILKETEDGVLEESVIGVLNKIKDYLFSSGMEYNKVETNLRKILSKDRSFTTKLDIRDQSQLDKLIKSDKSILARIQSKLDEERNREKVKQAKELIDKAIDTLK